ncbi:CFEM domain-containing protein [Hirsutella rhossiliensis]|uniref:CFEM domain-containing protein n=1 Tax=Hirsutella rhossiliensis TaxID=111463 RepID=A0A9P8MR40_9HYPO|nr:CFEM domain-containing protein [Hirsutella rhossiliensis]KAH0959634.1 CFEM domain-containing protein [Hirsutella rhossiliensis]
MKPTACIVALLTLVAAVDLATLQKTLPACSLECLAKGVAVHGCGLTQFTCQCARLEPIIRTVAPCLVKMGCSLENMTETARVVLNLCQEVAPDSVGASKASATARVATSGATSPRLELHAGCLAMAAVAAAVLMMR